MKNWELKVKQGCQLPRGLREGMVRTLEGWERTSLGAGCYLVETDEPVDAGIDITQAEMVPPLPRYIRSGGEVTDIKFLLPDVL